MRNAFLRIIQVQNAPNIPYYKDSRILKVAISPPDQCQYANLSGLETLYTNQSFNLHYNDTNSILKLILTETKPNNFDIACTIIPLEGIQENTLLHETRVMQAIVSGISSPLITFELQISSKPAKPINNPTKNLYPTLENIRTSDSSQKPFIPNDSCFTSIIKISQTQTSNNLFIKNDEDSYYSSDYDEEEDMIINARIFFNDESINLLKSSQNGCTTSVSRKQKEQTKSSIKPPENKSSSSTKNENNSIPFVPPNENDAPFLLPKSSSNEDSLKQSQPQNQNYGYQQPINSNDINPYMYQGQQNQNFQDQSPKYYQSNHQYYPQYQSNQKY